ncbi:MAG: hypothetical protein KUG82_18750 [Pseudomonadales bacterium]|nr:hypothetical protein [Pseudomonadales bacterium]
MNIQLFKTTSFLVLLCLTACGGGSEPTPADGDSSSDTTPSDSDEGSSVNTGSFVDSAVEGLAYSTETQTGRTNSNGEFNFLDGEIITFRVGQLNLGSAYASEFLTPLDLVNSYDVSEISASNLIRLLQTLDEDLDPENGIKIPLAASNISADIDLLDIASIDAGVAALSATLSLVDAAPAEQHMQDTLDELPSMAIEGVYSSITKQHSVIDNATCIYIDGSITVVRDTDDSLLYDVTFVRTDGGEDVFQFDDTSDRQHNIVTDEIFFNWSLKPDSGWLVLRQGDFTIQGAPTCFTKILLTTAPTNIAPVIQEPFGSEEFCVLPEDSYSLFWGFSAHDSDGYLIEPPIVNLTVSGITKVASSTSISNTCHDKSLIPDTGWTPKSPGDHACIDDAILVDIPCTEGVTWSVEATDNEGLTAILEGDFAAPFAEEESEDTNILICFENYPADACDIVADSYASIGGASVTSSPVGSCSDLVANPTQQINQGSGVFVAPTGPLGDLIVVYDAISDIELSSCLITSPRSTSIPDIDPDAGGNSDLPLAELTGLWISQEPSTDGNGENATDSYLQITADGNIVTYQVALDTGLGCTTWDTTAASYFSGTDVTIDGESFSVNAPDGEGGTVSLVYIPASAAPTGCTEL